MDAEQLPDTAPATSPADRLDSWKEIAAYLRRDVRTVQRWHDLAGLPVHRHIDAKQRGVADPDHPLRVRLSRVAAN